jgi:hypothetical protein
MTRQWLLLQALEKLGGATIEELLQTYPEGYACRRERCIAILRRWKFFSRLAPVMLVAASVGSL